MRIQSHSRVSRKLTQKTSTANANEHDPTLRLNLNKTSQYDSNYSHIKPGYRPHAHTSASTTEQLRSRASRRGWGKAVPCAADTMSVGCQSDEGVVWAARLVPEGRTGVNELW